MLNSMAVATAIGIRMSAVAVLLMTCPRIAVNRNSPTRSAIGPASPTVRTRSSASDSAVPDCCIAVDSGIMAATRMIVFQSIARYAPSTERMPKPTTAIAARRTPTAAGTIPVASTSTIPATMTSIAIEPRPSGTACRRTTSGWSTTRTSELLSCLSSAAHEPWSRSWSPARITAGSGCTTSPCCAVPSASPCGGSRGPRGRRSRAPCRGSW